MLGTPPVLWLERKRIPSVVAVLLVVAGMITILLIVGAIVGASINSFYTELPVYQTRLQEQVSAFQCVFGDQRHPGHGQGSARIYQSSSGDEPDRALARGVGLGTFEHCPDFAHRNLHPARGLKLSRSSSALFSVILSRHFPSSRGSSVILNAIWSSRRSSAWPRGS